MKPYEIPAAAEAVLQNGYVDEETGEWIFDKETYDALQCEFTDKIEWVLLHGKNAQYEADLIKAEADRIKEEIDGLMKRYKSKISERDRCYNYAEYCLAGETFETPRVQVKYSKAVSTEVQQSFVAWALEKGRDDLLSYAKPTANKTAIKAAIQGGEELPYCELKTGKMQVK